MKGYLYILRCSDASYYVGSTNDLEQRLGQHQAGLGANYTRKRLPVELVYYEEYDRIDEAFYREKQVQGWSRKKKEALIENRPEGLHLLATCQNHTHYSGRWFRLRSTTGAEKTGTKTTGAEKSLTETTRAENTGTETIGIKESLGNTDLLKLPKTAFLCSRQVSASAILKCYDWAIEQREQGNCVISGFHSQIEKDVLHYLLKGKQPIIVALARGLKEKLEPELKVPLQEGRLLIITSFDKEVKRVTSQTAQVRNLLMASLADQITIGYYSSGGQLEKLIKRISKPIHKIV